MWLGRQCPPGFAQLGHSTHGLVHSCQGLTKEQSFSLHLWIYC